MSALLEEMPPIDGFRTDRLEELTVKEAAYHTKTSRFYKLVAHTARGWPFPFDDLHHRKSVIVNCGIHGADARTQMETLVKVSNEISAVDGVQIVAFPSDEFGAPFTDAEFVAFAKSCGVHPNDQSFRLMAKVKVDGPDAHPVFKYLKVMSNMDAIGRDFGAFYYINRNSHMQGVGAHAEAIWKVLDRERNMTGVPDKYTRKAPPPGKSLPGYPVVAATA